jgi:hypothetical protein
MATSVPTGFVAPATPWLEPQPLPEAVDLGPGCDAGPLRQGLAALCNQPQVQPLVAFGSRGRGEARADSDLDLACGLGEVWPDAWQKLQVFAVGARYEEGPFALPAPRPALLAALEGRLAALEDTIAGMAP